MLGEIKNVAMLLVNIIDPKYIHKPTGQIWINISDLYSDSLIDEQVKRKIHIFNPESSAPGELLNLS